MTDFNIDEMIAREAARAEGALSALRQAVADKIVAGSVRHTISWAQDDAISESTQELWKWVHEFIESGVAPKEALRRVIDRCTRDLLSDRFRGSSTSHFSNSVDAATRAAYSRFVDSNRWRLEEDA